MHFFVAKGPPNVFLTNIQNEFSSAITTRVPHIIGGTVVLIYLFILHSFQAHNYRKNKKFKNLKKTVPLRSCTSTLATTRTKRNSVMQYNDNNNDGGKN